MILWTIQPVEVYNLIQEQGYYICDPTKSECLEDFDFKSAYDWLNKQMEQRIGPRPEGVLYPVWAWHTYAGKHKKPDLRTSLAKKGEECVCLEIEIPDDQVVLTEFDNWHYVLNNWHYNEAKDEAEWDEIEDWVDSLPEKERQEEIERSWEGIFDISIKNSDWNRNGYYVQATFWKLNKEQIRKIQFFKSR